MAFKDSILSWLFGPKPESPPEQEQPAPVLQSPEQEARPPSEPDPSVLKLSPEHPFIRLFALCGKDAALSPPVLSLDGLDPAVLPKELERLRSALSAAASARLSQCVPQKQEQGPEAEEKTPAPNLDAQPLVFLSADKLSAWLLIFPPAGEGAAATRQALSDALKKEGVRFGVDEELLDRLAREETPCFQLFLVARGQPAVHGADGRIIDRFARSIERKFAVDEHDRVDYASLNLVQNVEAGDVICEIVPPEKGVPGRTVQNQELPARDGKTVSAPKGRNTELSEDGRSLLAAQAGHVEFTGRTFQVKSVLEIEGNVDFSSGNINFVGDVHVHGDVCSGFTVRALGSINVDGVVEASTVEAGGDLVVTKGILGNNESVIRAHRSIFTKYLENSSVYARENLQADCIVNCDVYSDGEINVKSGRGTIIGGRLRAGRKITANIVGAQSEPRTLLFLGGLPCEEFERELLQREIDQIQEELDAVALQPASPAKSDRLSKGRMKLSVSRLKLGQMDKGLEAMTQELTEQGGRRVEADAAYPGTEITINGTTLRLTREVRPCNASLSEGEICLT